MRSSSSSIRSMCCIARRHYPTAHKLSQPLTHDTWWGQTLRLSPLSLSTITLVLLLLLLRHLLITHSPLFNLLFCNLNFFTIVSIEYFYQPLMVIVIAIKTTRLSQYTRLAYFKGSLLSPSDKISPLTEVLIINLYLPIK